MNAKTFGLAGLWAVTAIIAAVAIAKLHQTRAVNQQLRTELEAQTAMPVQPRRVSTESASTSGLTRDEKLELMRLRNEVTQLRTSAQAARDAVKAALENRLPRGETTETRLAAEVEATRERPREEWAFRGYATPAEAVESAIWAMKEGNVQTLLEALTPEGRRLFELRMAGKSEAEVVAMLQKQMEKLTTLHIKEQKQVSPTEVNLDMEVIEGQAVTHTLQMRLVGNEWKATAPFSFEYDPLAFYRRNPELMRRYFPHLVQQDDQQQQAQVPPADGTLPPEPSPNP